MVSLTIADVTMTAPTPTRLGRRLKERREASGLTMGQLATYSGVSKGTISQIESGRMRTPSGEILTKLAGELGTTVDYLLGKADAAESPSELESLARQVERAALPDADLASIKDYLRFQLQRARARSGEAIGRVADLLDRDVVDEPAKPNIEPDAQQKGQQE